MVGDRLCLRAEQLHRSTEYYLGCIHTQVSAQRGINVIPQVFSCAVSLRDNLKC